MKKVGISKIVIWAAIRNFKPNNKFWNYIKKQKIITTKKNYTDCIFTYSNSWENITYKTYIKNIWRHLTFCEFLVFIEKIIFKRH